MPVLKIDTNARQLEGFVPEFANQLRFAASVAINNTAKAVQGVQRKHQRKVFTVRRRTFVDRAVKIKPFSNKRTLTAIVKYDPPGGQDRADILTKFERRSVKRPRGSHIAIPEEARRTKAGVVSKANRPRSFNFRPHGGVVWKGSKRTFMIRKADGTGGIYQRVGRTKGRRLASTISTRRVRDVNVRVLYRFTPQARIDDRLKYVKNADRTVTLEFPKNYQKAYQKALRTAKAKGLRGVNNKTLLAALRRDQR